MIIIELPFPDAKLNPNRKNGKHWGSSINAKIAARDMGYFVTKEACSKMNANPSEYFRLGCKLDIKFIAPDKRKRDLDNLLSSAKSHIDGVCLALGLDDYQFVSVTLRRGYSKGAGAMIMEITGA